MRLQKLNFDVVVIDSEEEFIRQKKIRKIDVILLDIRTKGKERLRLIPLAKGKKNDTEIVLLSNQDCIAIAMEGMQAGAFDDITEPFDLDEIIKKICAAWQRKCRHKTKGKGRLTRFLEKTMMAVTYAEAGEFETAIRLAGKEDKKITSEQLAGNDKDPPAKDLTRRGCS